jgi:hypothetical protein
VHKKNKHREVKHRMYHFCLLTLSTHYRTAPGVVRCLQMLSFKHTAIKIQIPCSTLRSIAEFSYIWMYHRCFDRGHMGMLEFKLSEMVPCSAWENYLSQGSLDGLVWSKQSWLPELLYWTTNLCHKYALKTNKQINKENLFDSLPKNPKKTKTFNCLLTKSKSVLFKKLADPQLLITLQH